MQKHMRIIMAAILFMAGPAGAASIEGVTFPERQVVDGRELDLRGTALLRYMVFIKAYVGAFYLEPEVPSEKALDGFVPRRLVLHYFHAIDAKDFAEATTRMIEKNVSSEAFRDLEGKIAQLNRFYQDVEPGDRYTATYIPGKGTQLALNDQVLGSVPGPDFSAAFFSIWIGKNPIDTSFRDRLLGKR